MYKVFFLLFAPGMAWDRIAAAGRGFFFILGTQLLPFIALDVLVQGWSLEKHGHWQPHLQITKTFTHTTVVHFEILQAALLLAMVLVSALLVWLAAENFHGRRSYLMVFTTIAYAYSPLFLADLLLASPTLNPIIPWGLGVMGTIWVLYQGIPRGLKTDPVHAFGIYLTSIMIVVLMSGLVHIRPALYPIGRGEC